MAFYSALVVYMVWRLPSQDSGWRLWAGILILLLGVVGFVGAVLQPSVFGRKR